MQYYQRRFVAALAAALVFNILPRLVGAYFLSRKMPSPIFSTAFCVATLPPAFADDRGFPNSILLTVARAHANTLIAQRCRSTSSSRPPLPAATKLILRRT